MATRRGVLLDQYLSARNAMGGVTAREKSVRGMPEWEIEIIPITRPKD
jgi:hypothetical protein